MFSCFSEPLKSSDTILKGPSFYAKFVVFKSSHFGDKFLVVLKKTNQVVVAFLGLGRHSAGPPFGFPTWGSSSRELEAPPGIPFGPGSPSLLETTWRPRRWSFPWPEALKGAIFLCRMAGPVHTQQPRLDLGHPPPWSSHWEPVVPRRAEEPESRCPKVPVGELGDSSSQKNPVIPFRLPAFLAYSFSSSTTPPPLAPPEAFLGQAIRSPSGQEDLPAHDQIQATLGAKKAPHSPASVWERQNPGPVWAFEYLALES